MIPTRTLVHFSTMLSRCTEWVASYGAGWACNVRKSHYDWHHRGSLLCVHADELWTNTSWAQDVANLTAGRMFLPRRPSSAEDLLVVITKVLVTTAADEVQGEHLTLRSGNVPSPNFCCVFILKNRLLLLYCTGQMASWNHYLSLVPGGYEATIMIT